MYCIWWYCILWAVLSRSLMVKMSFQILWPNHYKSKPSLYHDPNRACHTTLHRILRTVSFIMSPPHSLVTVGIAKQKWDLLLNITVFHLRSQIFPSTVTWKFDADKFCGQLSKKPTLGFCSNLFLPACWRCCCQPK